MRLSADLLAFQARIGHEFRRPELLLRAVTHASIGSATRPDNQRLEFLGDRVLGLMIAETVYQRYPKETEGDLAKRLAAKAASKCSWAISKFFCWHCDQPWL